MLSLNTKQYLDPKVLIVSVLLHHLGERLSLWSIALGGTVHYPATPPVRRAISLAETITAFWSASLRIHLQSSSLSHDLPCIMIT